MAATTKALKAKRDRLLLEQEISQIESQRAADEQIARVVESVYGGFGYEGATVVDRFEYLHDDGRFDRNYQHHASTAADYHRGDNSPHWRTEQELSEIRGICRFLSQISETAIGIRDTRRNFVVGQGFEITVQPKPEFKADPEATSIASRATAWLEGQFERNRWLGELEFEAFNTLLEDGEQVWIVEPHPEDERHIVFRLEQPDFLTEPGNPAEVGDSVGVGTELEWKYGIASPWHRSDESLAYYIMPYQAVDATVYRPWQVEHVKANVRRYVKRGVGDFYPVWQTLQKMERVLANTTHGAAVQAAIAYIREHAPGKSAEAISKFAGARADNKGTYVTGSGARDIRTRKALPGTVVDVQQGAKYHAGPLGANQSPIYIEVIQQALRVVGLRWQMPEYMVSGDASNANYASTLVAESPFVKSCQSYQYWLAQHYRRLFRKVILMGIRRGLLPFPARAFDQFCTLSVEGQDVAARDEQQGHALRKSQYESGLLSKESWAAAEGLDLADEQAKGAEEQQAAEPATGGRPVFESWYSYP